MQDIRETTSTKKPQTIITRCVYVIGIYVIESTVLCWSLRQSFVRLPDCWSTGLLRNINKIHTIKLLIVCLAVRTDKDATRHRCAIRRASRLAVDAERCDVCPPLLERFRNGRHITHNLSVACFWLKSFHFRPTMMHSPKRESENEEKAPFDSSFSQSTLH